MQLIKYKPQITKENPFLMWIFTITQMFRP